MELERGRTWIKLDSAGRIEATTWEKKWRSLSPSLAHKLFVKVCLKVSIDDNVAASNQVPHQTFFQRRKEGDGAGAEEPGISGIVEEELLGNN